MNSEVLDDDIGTHDAQNVAWTRALHYVIVPREPDGAKLPILRWQRVMRFPAEEKHD